MAIVHHGSPCQGACMTVESNLTSVICLYCSDYQYHLIGIIIVQSSHRCVAKLIVTLSCRHKHVTDIKLDSTVVHLNKILLLWGLFWKNLISPA